jgi:hypothetical protein
MEGTVNGTAALWRDRIAAQQASGTPRPMSGTSFVRDAVRAMFHWAADPDRGNLLPEGFRNPFRRSGVTGRPIAVDPFSEPDITIAMAERFIDACDAYHTDSH